MDSKETGLSFIEVQNKQRQFGLNEIAHEKAPAWYGSHLKQYRLQNSFLFFALFLLSFQLFLFSFSRKNVCNHYRKNKEQCNNAIPQYRDGIIISVKSTNIEVY